MKIVLLGYMASGKSLIGKTLAQVLDYSFIDLDDYIEAKEQQSVKSIFENKGEIYFRKIEHQALKEVLLKDNNIVLSLGGGTPCYSGNMDLLLKEEQATTIYLQVSIPEIITRLHAEKDKRPLISHLKNETELIEFIGKHLFERSVFYNQAEHRIDANSKKQDIIESILLQLF